jgi:hypothetical protein
MSQVNSVRNPDGIWINSQAFREEGNKFKKYNYYIADPWGSPAWFEYWQEQRKRCIHGYSVGGVKITGEHYFYLNFTPIQKVDNINGNRADKVEGFPDFWDGDYNYFWSREIAKNGLIKALGVKEEFDEDFTIHTKTLPEAEAQKKLLQKYFDGLQLEVRIEVDYLGGGYNLIVGKSRRKGYSLKNQAIAANNYQTIPKSYTAFGAYEKRFLYPGAIFSYTMDTINFVNSNTAWAMPSDVLKKADHIKSSYIEYKNGIKLESGFKSEIQAVTFKDNPDALRGKNAKDIFFEESGAFGTPGLLKASYAASQDCVMAGAIKTGMITIFGTSGDMEGGTYDYADMFSRPEAFDLMPFINIWDEDSLTTKVGFFHPINWNMEGFYDEQGNSNKKAAKDLELSIRAKLVKNGATSTELQQRMQEKPLGPGEAFAAVSSNTFPVVELKQQLQKVKANDWQRIKGTPVDLLYEDGKITAKPILDGSKEPITSYHHIPTNKRGCPVIYEHPVPNAPKGLYKIGYDPIRQEEGTSLASICVYKGVHIGTVYHSILVAEYIGRYEDPDDIDRIAEMFADLYSTTIMYENEVTGVKNYFRRIKRLNLLAIQPDAVISKNVKHSRVARVYGCHMNVQLKDAGERYVKSWLLTVLDYDENGNPIRVIDRIFSIRLLEELISYNRKGNFDLVSSLFMCMFQVQEEVLGKEYNEKKENNNVKMLLEMVNDMYKK